MERFLLNWLISSALTKMDSAHRRSHLGLVIPSKEADQVKACRRFLDAVSQRKQVS
jgi:hypothetical protein